jgi:hypothetical protein
LGVRLRQLQDNKTPGNLEQQKYRGCELAIAAESGQICQRSLASFSPTGAVLENPVNEGSLETDIVPCFFRFDPLMTQYLLQLCLVFPVEGGLFQQPFVFASHMESQSERQLSHDCRPMTIPFYTNVTIAIVELSLSGLRRFLNVNVV